MALESPPPSPITRGETVRAMAGYLLLYAILLNGLFWGERLHPGAILHNAVPFFSTSGPDNARYVNSIQGDVWRYFTPAERYQYESAKQGRFPTWNPHIYCGFAFHGNGQSAMLSPFRLPYFWIDPDIARGPLAILRLWLSALATYALARKLSLSPAAAFLSGASWTLAAFNIRWLLWTLSAATLWMPVLILALDSLLLAPSWRRFGLAGLAAMVLQLAGHPESQFQAGLIAGFYVAIRAVFLTIPLRQKITRLLECFASVLVGTAGAAAALLPFLLELLASADWQYALRHTRDGIPWQALVLLVAPDYFGRPRIGHNYDGPANYIETGSWFGLLTLALAIVALVCTFIRWKSTRSADRFLAAFGLFTIAFCVVVVFHVSPMAQWIGALPLISQSNNWRLLFGIQFAGALLAGLGFDLFAVSRSRLASRTTLIVLACFSALLVLLCVTGGHEALSALLDEPDLASLWHHRTARNAVGAALAIFNTCLLAAFVVRQRSPDPASRWWLRAIVAAGVIELLSVAWDFNPTSPIEIADPPAPPVLAETVRLAGPNRVSAVNDMLIPNLAMRYGFRDCRGYDFPIPLRLAEVLRRLELPLPMTLLPKSRLVPTLEPQLAAFLDRTGVTYLHVEENRPELVFASTTPHSDSKQKPWPMVMRGRTFDAAYHNPNAYPRAWFAETAVAGSSHEALEALLDPLTDLKRRTVFERPDESSMPQTPAKACGEATLVDDQEEEVTIRTKSATGGGVVLIDRMAAGWSVTVDGQPAAALWTNYLFRGVVVPAGKHEIRWTYRCPGLRAGIIISALALAALGAMLFLRREKTLAEPATPNRQ